MWRPARGGFCRGCAAWKLVSVCLRFSERGFYGARLGGACFRIPARRTERGFCGMTRGLAGLPPNACAASWARILRGATGWSLLPHTRRTERRFCRMTRGLTELAFVCLRFCECGFCWGAAWKDCFCMSALQRARILRGATGKDCFRLPALLRARSCWGATWKDCFCLPARLGRTVSVCRRFSKCGFCGAQLDGACFCLPARRTERGFCREMRGLEGLFLYVCAAH